MRRSKSEKNQSRWMAATLTVDSQPTISRFVERPRGRLALIS